MTCLVIMLLAFGFGFEGMAANIAVLPSVDGVIYDLASPDGIPDTTYLSLHELEAGEAYTYFRDGRQGRVILEFPLTGLSQVNTATLVLRLTSFRVDSFADVLAYGADGAIDLSDWARPASVITQITPIGPPFLYSIDVTTVVISALLAGQSHLGIRLEGGPASIGGYMGFVSTDWPKGGAITKQDNPQLLIDGELQLPEPATWHLMWPSLALLFFGLAMRPRPS